MRSPSSAARPTLPRALAAIAVALVMLLAPPATSSRAAPAPAEPSLGSVTVTPERGTADQGNVRLTTVSRAQPAGCPVGSTQALPVVTGPGGWAGGLAFSTFSSLPTSGEIEVPLQPSFAQVAAAAGTTIVPGRYDITLTCRNRLGVAFGSFRGTVWFTDAVNYQSTDPATSSTVTTIAFSDSPAGLSQLGAPVTLTAVVNPPSVDGTVEFVESDTGSSARLGSVPVVQGRAVLSLPRLAFGLHQLSVRFVPKDTKRFTGARSAAPDLVHVVAKPPPPRLTAAPKVAGAAAVGGTLSCTATATGASQVLFAWLRDGVAIDRQTAGTHKVVAADAGRGLRCRVSASNAGGQVDALSAVVAVRRSNARTTSAPRSTAVAGAQVHGTVRW